MKTTKIKFFEAILAILFNFLKEKDDLFSNVKSLSSYLLFLLTL